ncbi:uncharacterized protein LOC108214653 isoform X3 [Daucus carota subsp. sativus]|uniref:uncharacterized protein LOC108214653 isoform X3 n=1 Tax=Daucus carota subsp. sativus TaxID=79200 RepID=UPI0007EF82C4|nr:PREDICTED: uncharacterized protein LOC108214653 isoform X2 [Daucus carota subsp. sativus]
MLEAKSVRKAKIPASLLEHPTPAHIQPTRLALHVNQHASTCSLYIASAALIYKLTVSMEDSLISQGKESLLIPDQTTVLESDLVDRCPHRSEIQSIVLAETDSGENTILGSVDSYGHLIVSKAIVNDKDPDVSRIIYSACPQDCGVGEGSWAGLCFSPVQWSMAAVARSYCKSVDIYDQDIHLRTLRTLRYPTSLSFVQNLSCGYGSSLLAVTEGCQLSLWDLRVKENNGCVHRITGSVGDTLYAVSNSSNGNIAVGGADRTVTIYDPRRLTAISRLLVWLSHVLTLTTSLYKGLIMRSFVGNGKKA